ncbi:MAG TPA: DUF2232 domain-containing protein [Thermodesulfobium narugense]|nr:MAG: hypothetical protein C0174_04120 [Thermodesulfobium narugense]HEM55933.1 DUF2232 domain-containing protein [Thermodesulfobium narugense]
MLKKNFDAIEVFLASALVVFFVLFGVYVPTFGFLGLLLMAVPICIVTYRRGIFYGVLTLLLSGIILAILLPYIISVIFCTINFSLGIVMGLILRKEKPINVLLGTTATLSGLFALGVAFFILTGPKDLLSNLYAAFESYMISYYQGSSGVTTEEVKQFVKYIEIYLPSLVILLFFIWSVFQYRIVSYVLRYLYKVEVPQFGDFKEVRIPYELSFLFLASLIASFLPISNEIKNAFLNVELILTFIYMFAGASVLFFILSKKLFFKNDTITKIINLIVVLLFVIVPFLSFFLVFLGVFDSVFNIRKYFKL